MTANLKHCPIHSYFAAGFDTCPECDSKPVILQTSEPQTVTVVRGKQSRGKPPKERKPRKRKGDGSLHATPQPVAIPKTIAALLKTETRVRVVGIDTLLEKLVNAGMDTNSKIVEGLRTGRTMQTIGWEKNYLKVIDYLLDEGYAVAKYRARVVCGSEAA